MTNSLKQKIFTLKFLFTFKAKEMKKSQLIFNYELTVKSVIFSLSCDGLVLVWIYKSENALSTVNLIIISTCIEIYIKSCNFIKVLSLWGKINTLDMKTQTVIAIFCIFSIISCDNSNEASEAIEAFETTDDNMEKSICEGREPSTDVAFVRIGRYRKNHF